MNAIIYARYSSDRQREESIEDQLRICRQWCEDNGHDVVGVFADKAMTGRTDKRPQFLAMVKNPMGAQLCVVYKMDRFSRNKYDAAHYKKVLADKGCRVVSATEAVPDSPEGIIIESLLEGMAAYYSANLAQNVRRGMEGNALKCKAQGYRVYGYDVGSDGCYIINESEARVVHEVFTRYAAGEPVRTIMQDLKARGIVNKAGKPFSDSALRDMVKNEKYTGVYTWSDVRIEDGMPRIIDADLWKRAQSRVPLPRGMHQGKQERYILAGRVFCGKCGEPMHGTCTVKGAKRYRYYGARKGCPRVSADLLEKRCGEAVEKLVRDPERIQDVAQALTDYMNSQIDTKEYEETRQKHSEAVSGRDNLLNVLQSGFESKGVLERLSQLESQIAYLEARMIDLEQAMLFTDVSEVVEFLEDAATLLPWENTLRAFVQKVDVFDGYAIAVFSYTKDGIAPGQTIDLGQSSEFSDLVEQTPLCANCYVIRQYVVFVVPLAA